MTHQTDKTEETANMGARAAQEPAAAPAASSVMPYSPDYHTPTPGEIPVVAYALAIADTFQLNSDAVCEPEEDFTPFVPAEPEDATLLDDRQNVLNAVAAGFNLGTKVLKREEVENGNFLKFGYRKIGVVLQNGEVRSDTGNYIKNTAVINPSKPEEKYKSATKGYSIKDEPGLTDLEADGEGSLLADYRKVHDTLRAQGLEKLVHINLLPIHGLGSAPDYVAYLNVYARRFRPAYWSFDLYPILEYRPAITPAPFFGQCHNLRPGEGVQLHEHFLRTLEMMLAQSRKSGKPFWYYPMSSEFTDKGAYYPYPLEQYLRYQVFTALAYGARGICPWRYIQDYSSVDSIFTPVADISKYEMFLTNPLNIDRTRTPAWYFVRRVNREIREYGHVFLSSRVEAVYHTGISVMQQEARRHNTPKPVETESGGVKKVTWPEITTRFGAAPDLTASDPTAPGSFTNRYNWGLRQLTAGAIPPLVTVTTPSGELGVTVSDLRPEKTGVSRAGAVVPDPGANAERGHIVIVNHDAFNYQTVRLGFAGDYALEELTPRTSGGEAPTGRILCYTSPTLERILPPGGYLIFQWTSYPKVVGPVTGQV